MSVSQMTTDMSVSQMTTDMSVSHDHGYVPSVVETIASFFPRSCIIIEYDVSPVLTCVSRRLSLVEMKFLTLQYHLRSLLV